MNTDKGESNKRQTPKKENQLLSSVHEDMVKYLLLIYRKFIKIKGFF